MPHPTYFPELVINYRLLILLQQLQEETAEGGEEPAAEGESFDFGDMKKKKKKSKKVDFSAFEDGQEQEGEDGGTRDPDDVFAADDGEGSSSAAKSGADAEEGWIGTNRDYTYTEVSTRDLLNSHQWATHGMPSEFIMY